jgi:hypothetical protein
VADVDTQGVEDPKLFVWPGKGVYAVFGRKPEALGASPYCKDPIFVQFVVQVRASSVCKAQVASGVVFRDNHRRMSAVLAFVVACGSV